MQTRSALINLPVPSCMTTYLHSSRIQKGVLRYSLRPMLICVRIYVRTTLALFGTFSESLRTHMNYETEIMGFNVAPTIP
jgi:hypothetical protein